MPRIGIKRMACSYIRAVFFKHKNNDGATDERGIRSHRSRHQWLRLKRFYAPLYMHYDKDTTPPRQHECGGLGVLAVLNANLLAQMFS